MAEAPAGPRVVFCMAAAHGVCAPFLRWVWGCERRLVKAPSGRQRLKVVAAWPATTRDLCTVQHLTSSTADTVCAFRRLLAGAQAGVPLTSVLDKARYQRCARGHSLAQRLGIAVLCLPAYAPNLHLLERVWKFVKKPWLYAKYSADPHAFQHAIIACIAQAPDKHTEELASLLPLQCQSFKAVHVIGAESHVSLFPVARQTREKGSSKAA